MAEKVAKKSLIQRFRDRRPEDYNATWIGFVALATVAVVVLAAVGVKSLGIGETDYTAQFAQAASLKPGNIVTVAGIEVGNVRSVKLVDGHVEVGLTVRDDVKLGKDTKAAIQLQTFLGGRYLALTPAGPGSVPDNTISLANTEVPYDLQELLGDGSVMLSQLDSDQLGESLAVLGKQVNGLPEIVPQAMDNIHKLSSVIADRRDQLGTLFESTERVANTLHSQQARVGVLIDRGQNLLGEFVASQATFRALLVALTGLTNNLDKIVVNNRPMLNDMLKDVRELTDMLGHNDELVSNLLQVAPVTLRGLTNATGYAPALEFFIPNGLAIDSWMCAISGRADQFNMIEYYKDCK
ncbi:putative MCE family protein [Mycolicibacterium cyprinidarum]|uniref:MCE family protein n=1 Tax=Mycolicibacterium cyprinidarum TaxID=2860311 RepID=A0ABQ4V8Q3_9MYCO|nr:putative MCE family protein [Mycolicibacterium sp. NGTWSNA01]GJF19242.1 putative MCE family protein [Mycolicibacterium sp. NGTWS0302]GJF19652.1 putative MCE family protein [Mycolicibacterium sp. NGTWS1803]